MSLTVLTQKTPTVIHMDQPHNENMNRSRLKNNFIYLNEDHLVKVKNLIENKNPFFTEAYKSLIDQANKELVKSPNPVTNKNQIPPSGDKHDYMSIAPYRWPNPNTPDGSPWIVKDGEINPMTRGNDTDKVRLSEMFGALDNLSMAYFFSEDITYANKAKAIIKTWFIDDETKVNPNINYGPGIPGEVEGRRAGMIEWSNISTVVTTIQLLESNKVFNTTEMKVLNTWLMDYYTWVKTNKMGIENDNGTQNHSTNFDYQLVGPARYLGLDSEAITRLEDAKTKRIAVQITPDGKQPNELGRTKSVHYCSMNLRIMAFVAEMGIPLGVDLWNYSTSDGRSMKKAFEYLKPFVEGKEKWQYKQITEGGAEKAIEVQMKPLFSIASTIFNEELINESVLDYQNMTYLEKLQYPPLSKIN
ncbi:alginate lyase family protein [Kriegella aquimaris]|nr:alginate lyase family protein [Kriegella aquimaris]